MMKEYILKVRTWKNRRELIKEETYVIDDIVIDGCFFSAGVVMPEIKKVIFNEPATIVIWADGTKTVVKCCEGDEFDAEKGLAMAISKKALGDLKEVKKWAKEYEKEVTQVQAILDSFREAMRRLSGR